MANYANFVGSLEPCEEWTNFPQSGDSSRATLLLSNLNGDSTSFSTNAAIDSNDHGLAFAEEFFAEQPAPYHLNVNSRPSFSLAQRETGYAISGARDSLNFSGSGLHNLDFSPFSQLSSNSVNVFDMSTTTSLPGPTTETDAVRLSSSSPDSSLLTSVQSQSDTPLKTYTCKVNSCLHTSFSSKACLDRHKREVHERSHVRCCPVVTCKRHTKGFPRKYNLFEHMKRCHPNVSPREQSRVHEEEDVSGSETVIMEHVPSSRRMKDELERLRAIREEVDIDIQALERTMSMFRDSSF